MSRHSANLARSDRLKSAFFKRLLIGDRPFFSPKPFRLPSQCLHASVVQNRLHFDLRISYSATLSRPSFRLTINFPSIFQRPFWSAFFSSAMFAQSLGLAPPAIRFRICSNHSEDSHPRSQGAFGERSGVVPIAATHTFNILGQNTEQDHQG